ncbi:hypothetical protein [Veronia nyctiphanis]|uniref:hypothetical protein n=1 Tax=Veronia nyctiphanis TaxID=1278244 RepID=UPI001F27BB21|nr:hypothetical protein [Veronia nyctiphanis]
MKNITVSLFGLLLVSTALSAQQTDLIDWQLNVGIDDKAIAEKYLAEAKKPDVMHQVLRRYEFDIKDEEVSKTITIINYYPKFTDIEDYGSQSIYFNRNTERVTVLSASSVSPRGTLTTFSLIVPGYETQIHTTPLLTGKSLLCLSQLWSKAGSLLLSSMLLRTVMPKRWTGRPVSGRRTTTL